MSGVIQTCLSVSGLCVVMWGVVSGGLIVVCRCGSVCKQIKVHTRGCRKAVRTGKQVVCPCTCSYHKDNTKVTSIWFLFHKELQN